MLPGSAVAAVPLSHESLGINFTGSPTDLATAAAAGVGLARDEVIAGSNTDAVVELTAAAGLRLYPMSNTWPCSWLVGLLQFPYCTGRELVVGGVNEEAAARCTRP